MIPDIPDLGIMPPDLPEIEEPPLEPGTENPFIECTILEDGMEWSPAAAVSTSCSTTIC